MARPQKPVVAAVLLVLLLLFLVRRLSTPTRTVVFLRTQPEALPSSEPDDHCEGDEPPNPIAASREACEAVGCRWDEDDDPCHCNSQQLCESPAVGGTWTARSLTCGGGQLQGASPSWACDAADAWLIDHFAGVCCRGGTASSKCNCEALDCAFNPCMDPNDFDPMAAVPYANCDGDSENGNPIAASQEGC